MEMFSHPQTITEFANITDAALPYLYWRIFGMIGSMWKMIEVTSTQKQVVDSGL